MLIGFVGDTHGHVFELLALVVRWQRETGSRLDLVVQLGDFGVLYETLDPEAFPRDSYERIDPGQFDLTRLVAAEGELADVLGAIREELTAPILFLSGNHDELAGWRDRFGLFEHVADGDVVHRAGLGIGFVGCGADHALDLDAVDRLLSAKRLDVLATHTGPFGVWRGRYGDIYGSWDLTRVLAHQEPRHCVSGHFHHLIGPLKLGKTSYLGLAGLTSGRWESFPGLARGCMAALDTCTGAMSVVEAEWLSEIGGFGTGFDLVDWFDSVPG